MQNIVIAYKREMQNEANFGAILQATPTYQASYISRYVMQDLVTRPAARCQTPFNNTNKFTFDSALAATTQIVTRFLLIK